MILQKAAVVSKVRQQVSVAGRLVRYPFNEYWHHGSVQIDYGNGTVLVQPGRQLVAKEALEFATLDESGEIVSWTKSPR